MNNNDIPFILKDIVEKNNDLFVPKEFNNHFTNGFPEAISIDELKEIPKLKYFYIL